MTPYHLSNTAKKQIISRRKRVGIFFGVVVGIGVCIVLGEIIFQKIMQGPVWLAQSLEKQGSAVMNLLTPKQVLLGRIAELEEQVQNDAVDRITLQTLKYDYNALREATNYESETPSFITARVIGKPNRSLFNSIILDRGENQGIKIGQLITVKGAIALGRVSDISSSTATVMLFSGPQFDGEVIIQNKNGITVPAVGKGSGNFEIHIPREIEIHEGDLLALPENPLLAIGAVKSIQFDPRDPFQTILARIPINVQELQFVEVVK